MNQNQKMTMGLLPQPKFNYRSLFIAVAVHGMLITCLLYTSIVLFIPNRLSLA